MTGKKNVKQHHWHLSFTYALCCAYVRLSLLRVVRCGGKGLYGAVALHECVDFVRKIADREFLRIAEVNRPIIVPVHELHEAIDKIVHELEGTCLGPLAVDGDGLAL